MTTTTILPAWADLSDVDKGAVLLHLHKREWEGAAYAVEEYPAVFFDHPALLALDRRDACRFAVSARRDAEALPEAKHTRLYQLAADEPNRRCLWAARGDNGYLAVTSYSTDPRQAARDLLVSWGEQDMSGVVVHRTEAGGDWHEVGGCAGCTAVNR